MIKNDFNDNWIYTSSESVKGKEVTLPHDAMLNEPRSDSAKSGINGCWYMGGDYTYGKRFKNEDIVGKTAILEFEGVYHNAEVYVNGVLKAARPYGYTNFYVDVTDDISESGINTVKVVAKNSDQPNSRWYSGAGIYRPVWLWTGDKKHIEINGIKVKTLSVNPARIEISVKTNCEGEVNLSVKDKDGNVVACETRQSYGLIKVQTEIKNAKLWSAETPYLYKVEASFYSDTYSETFGIRTITCDATSGLNVNGERVILRGACIHHDNGILGAATYDFAEERKIRLLKENGYNAVRSAHNPCSKALLNACDKLGMYVMDEYVDMWYIHKTKYDYANYFDKWWKEDLSDMVDKDYNHPSVIIYSIGNEVSETAQKRGIELCRQMSEHLHSLDYRPVSCGINIFFNFLSSMGFGVYSDKKADKALEDTKHKKSVGSEFFNDLAGILGDDVMKVGATLHGSDVKTRDAFANLDIAGYNYGILRYKKDLKKYPQRVILGSETFCKDAWYFWKMATEHKAIIGDFVWAGMDYLGEVGIGAWEYKEYAPEFDHNVGWMTAGSGRIDITGKPNGEAAYKKVVYGLDKINLAVTPVGFSKHSPSAWKMTNAMESWSWQGREGQKTDVEVYSYGDIVELYINDKLLATKKCSKTCRTVFKNVRYENGTLKAVVYKDGEKYAETKLTTAKMDTVLTVAPENETLKTTDLAYVRLKFTDTNGEVKPLVRGEIEVKVDNGTLLGLGNGCSYNERGYLTDKTDSYYGEALAIVKPQKAGVMTVFAKSGVGEANATIEVTND